MGRCCHSLLKSIIKKDKSYVILFTFDEFVSVHVSIN